MTPNELDELNKKLDRVITLLDGDNGNPGLRVRMDRIEQGNKVAVWVLGVIFVAVVGLIVKNFEVKQQRDSGAVRGELR